MLPITVRRLKPVCGPATFWSASTAATVRKSIDVPKILVSIGSWSKANYVVRRSGVDVKMPGLIVGEVPLDLSLYLPVLRWT